MIRKAALPELLAPAGDFSSLLAAVAAGADAVYVGGKDFGARAFAKNFDVGELKEAVEYCHLHGVKLYVTVNTLVFDRELDALTEYISDLYEIGVDAIIAADVGVIRRIKEIAPDFEVHASTQLSVHNTLGANAAAALGCERVVLARELSLENIVSVTKNADVETEIFLHGALCVCHSGQCLMSSLVGGRSGNRGECAQPCRLPYNNGKYPLSLSDLSLAEHIPELIASGTASLKIEGRMKSPEYVYTVTKIYRRLLDEGRRASRKEYEELSAVFSRGGFTDGYLVGKKDGKMTGTRSEADKEKTRTLTPYAPTLIKKQITAEATIRLGEPTRLTLSTNDRSVTVTAEPPSPAITSALKEGEVKARLAKLGNTPFALRAEDVALTLDEGVNLSPAAINALRREAVAKLLFSGRKRPIPPPRVAKPQKSRKPMRTAQLMKLDVARTLGESGVLGFFDIVFLPLEGFSGESEGIYLPPVIFDTEIDTVTTLLEKAVAHGAKFALVGNISHLTLAKRFSLTPVGDFRLNITNSIAREVYMELGVLDSVLSCELTLPMARDISGGEIVYGKIPLMLTERCFIKENFGCSRCESAALVDRRGGRFPLMREFGHRNLILNSVPTYMADRGEELSRAKIVHTHYIFTNETAKEAADVIARAKRGEHLNVAVRRIGKRD